MKFTITTPPATRPVDFPMAQAHIRDVPDSEQAAVELMIDAATDYAQETMGCSLVTQTITAVYYEDDAPPYCGVPRVLDPETIGGLGYSYTRGPSLPLPRGPVTSVVSVTDASGNAVTNYTVEKVGNSDRLRVPSVSYPLTVVYVAGAATSTAVPAMIRQAILAHVGTLYERRESTSDKTISTVPHSLDAFYRVRNRNTGVG